MSTKKVKKEREQATNDLHWVLSSQFGRRFVKRILDAANLDSTGFDRDPLINAFNQGARHIGMMLRRELKEDHFLLWADMESEARRDEEDKSMEVKPEDQEE